MISYFEKGSLVLTNTGYKSIEGLSVGDIVLTQFGDWCRIINTETKNIKDCNIYTIEGKELLPLSLVSGSKVLIKRSTVDTVEWLCAEDVKKGYFVSFTVPQEHEEFEDNLGMFNAYLYPTLQIKNEKQLETNPSFINGRFLFSSINSVTITKSNKDTVMYGLEIENDHTYIVNGAIVKN